MMEAHRTFREDLRSQAIVRRNWKEIFLVDTELGMEVNLLDKYMMLTLTNMQDAARKRNAEDIAPARNLYLSIWNTLGAKPKSNMVSHLDTIGEDGPTLLWTLLTQYHGTADQIIWLMRHKIDAFKDHLKLCLGDMDKFCDHVRKTVESLKAAGWTDDQAFDKVYEALVETHLTSLTNPSKYGNKSWTNQVQRIQNRFLPY